MDVTELLDLQSGVVSRRQVLAQGGKDHEIRRLVRRGSWVVLHPGVYLSHTGVPTWRQRAHAAVLYAGPDAALDRESAIRADAGPGWRGYPDDAPIHVAVDLRRTVKQVPGVRIRRLAGLSAKVRWNASPPRVLVEEAALDLALAKPDPYAALESLAGPVRGRCTTAQRLLEALEARQRVPGRQLLVDLLTDLRDGTCSVLEHGYLTLVERAHHLPEGQRQVHDRSPGPARRSLYRDVAYDGFELLVELDGRATHDKSEQRDADLDRDLDAATRQRTTIRLGYGQVFQRPCRTAGRLGRVFRQRGWATEPTPCGPGCAVIESFAA